MFAFSWLSAALLLSTLARVTCKTRSVSGLEPYIPPVPPLFPKLPQDLFYPFNLGSGAT